ncbi:NAD(P)/FAD-dependent oxidoreductase [Streptomyces sp. NBC_00582]|uniref:NAD(P)/FAD-dependent oxidoreductase n=1 Tax=Streptomyces sp. NBC_00582 TaxID=2975783 RepID=UPI002E80E772|nr:NAD(P)/FAD-dependent oxidoreductase [Streptomyces sp. NBC_00582]WUB67504.1 NAD(P)/FAD-dependent oxidoreductase [Streptomyces sp. NBC_00582]
MSAPVPPSGAPAALETELLIVGAGPTGLFACYYAGMRGLDATLVDSLPHLGGQVAALYPDKEIFDVAGFPAVRGRELVERLTQQAETASPSVLLGESAMELRRDDAGAVVVTTDAGRVIRAGAVLITGGIGRFTPRPLPALTAFAGEGVHHLVEPPHAYTDRQVVIVGGGDSAVDWANTLAPHARQVTLVHRRTRFRAHQFSVDRLMDSPVRVLTNSEIAEVHGTESLKAVTVRDCGTDALETVDADVLIPALGHIASLGPLTTWGLTLDRQQIQVDSSMSAGLDRVYAAGDITTYPGKVRLMAVGFGEAATAVNNIAVRLRPDEDLFPGHSSERPPTPTP